MRGLTAALLIPPLVLLVFVGSVLSGISALLTPQRTLAVIENSHAVAPLYRVALDRLANSANGEGETGPLGLDNAGFAQLIEAVIPEPQVEQWLRTLIPAFYAWLATDDPHLSIPLDLTAFKQRLGHAIEAVLADRVREVGDCTAEDRTKLEAGDVTLCRLPGESDEQLLRRVHESGMVTTFVAKFPDAVSVPDFTPVASAIGSPASAPTPEQSLTQLERVRSAYRQRGQLQLAVWGVAAFLFLLQILVHRTQYRRLLRWSGLTLLAVGVLPLLLGIVGAAGTVGAVLQDRLPATLDADARAAAAQLIGAAVAEVLRIPLFVGLATVVAGFALTVASLLHPHRALEPEGGKRR